MRNFKEEEIAPDNNRDEFNNAFRNAQDEGTNKIDDTGSFKKVIVFVCGVTSLVKELTGYRGNEQIESNSDSK